MADLKKFLDQSGVSTLWSKVAENIKAEEERAKLAEQEAKAAAEAAQADVDALETLVGVLPEGTEAKTIIEYVNKKTDGIATDTALAELQGVVNEHEASLAVLEGGADVVGSVANTATTVAAAKVAEIVAGADAKFDTLKEIADWILTDTTGAVGMAADIDALEAKLAGVDTTVVAKIGTEIENALKVDGVDKYALASDLTVLAGRVKALEDAGHVTQAAIDTALKAAKDYADGLAVNYDAVGTAETKANAAEANAKAYADGLAKNYATAEQGAKAESALQAADIATGGTNGTIAVKGTNVAIKGLGSAAFTEATAYDASGAAAQALVDAKAYTDNEINTKVIALTTAEIEAAIASVNAQA